MIYRECAGHKLNTCEYPKAHKRCPPKCTRLCIKGKHPNYQGLRIKKEGHKLGDMLSEIATRRVPSIAEMTQMDMLSMGNVANPLTHQANAKEGKVKLYQRQAIRLASEILAQPQFKSTKYPPPRWCSLIRVNSDCNQLRREQCQLCQWFRG